MVAVQNANPPPIVSLVYGVTNVDGSGYDRMDDDQGIKSKVGGAIINGEYSSQETKAST